MPSRQSKCGVGSISQWSSLSAQPRLYFSIRELSLTGMALKVCIERSRRGLKPAPPVTVMKSHGNNFTGYELPMLAGLMLCAFCQKFKNLSLRYLAIYGVGSLVAYSYIKYKTPWCIVSFGWPFLFIFGAAVLLVRPKHLRIAYGTIGALLCISLGSSIWLNYFRCSSPDEPYAYVQTYNDMFKLTKPLLKLAKRNPAYYHLTGHLIRSSTYPLPWMLGDFDRVGYYEGGNMPANVDGDFLLVQQDKIKEVELKLKGKYYNDTVTIRNYQ